MESPPTLFRRRVQKQLATQWILEAPGERIAEKSDPTRGSSTDSRTGGRSVESFLWDAPPGVDVHAIIRQWKAVKGAYDVERRRMPSPIRAERGYTDDGARSWKQTIGYAARAGGDAPMSI